MRGIGENLRFQVSIEKLKIEGVKSELITEDIKMFSDGFIEVNNLSGDFLLKGKNSKLINETILIEGDYIDGNFSNLVDKKQINLLKVSDKKISYIKNKDIEIFAKKINFNNNTSIIELIDDVTIIRNGEKVSGDYGTLDTKKNSYKIKSTDQTKVKAIIQDNE